MPRHFLINLMIVFCTGVLASATNAVALSGDAASEVSRLTPYRPNYAIVQSTTDDVSALEAHYSFRYSFTAPLESDDRGVDLFFSYTGEFDFYWFEQRESSPVVNRLNNPAFHLRLQPNVGWLRWLDIGAEHRSNGQSLDPHDRGADGTGELRAQVEYESGNHDYFDGMSRGANYVSAEGHWHVGKDRAAGSDRDPVLGFDLWASGKYYITDNSDVTWGPEADLDVSTADYDRFRVIATNRFSVLNQVFREIWLTAEWTVGDEGLDTDSWDFAAFLPIDFTDGFRIPLYARYHTGPLSTLSNYTKDQESFGVGIRLR